jgi:hypothetical protein
MASKKTVTFQDTFLFMNVLESLGVYLNEGLLAKESRILIDTGSSKNLL